MSNNKTCSRNPHQLNPQKNTWYHSDRRVKVLSFVTLLSLVTKILTCIFMCFKSEESEEDEFNITH